MNLNYAIIGSAKDADTLTVSIEKQGDHVLESNSDPDMLKSLLGGKRPDRILVVLEDGENHVDTIQATRDAFPSTLLIFSGLKLDKSILDTLSLDRPFTIATGAGVLPPIVPNMDIDNGLNRLNLTRRQQEIAGLLVEGLSRVEIRESMGLAEPTVKFHIRELTEKLSEPSRAMNVTQLSVLLTKVSCGAPLPDHLKINDLPNANVELPQLD